ncbi:hypothetical protein P4O66_013035, partial [Electrophorus voltai]
KKKQQSRIGIFQKSSAHAQPARTHTNPYSLEFCEENIEFWLACEEFQQIKSPSKRISRAKAIYKKFIKEV